MAVGNVVGSLMIIGSTALHILHMPLESRQDLLLAQAILTVNMFIVGPLGYWCVVKKKAIYDFFAGERRYLSFTVLTVVLIFVAMLVNTYFVYWNAHLQLPAWLSKAAHWAKHKEESLKHLTDLLTTFASWQDLGIGIVVMSLMPAVGEEIVFRGILQSILNKRLNSHLAIWGVAFIFSAIHLQFYGFVPRFLLGALFGYLYSWTHNLFYPMLAHFVNNSFTLALAFMHQHTTQQFSEEHHLLPLPIFISCFVIGAAISVYIYQQTKYLRHH